MSTLDRPRLRPGLAAVQDPHDPRFILVQDAWGLSGYTQRLTQVEFAWVRYFDGSRTLHTLHTEVLQQQRGPTLSLDLLTRLVERLDAALFLDSPRFRQRHEGPIREPSCLRCYGTNPDRIRRDLDALFDGPAGPGRPRPTRPRGNLRAALVPHIDYARGGATYAWGYKEVVEQTDASLFVIVATSHYSGRRFTLTRKHFKTPLGTTPTDHGYVDRLVRHYGDGLFDDELAHLPEHSIELEVVLLQHLVQARRPIRIVPLLVGTFYDLVRSGKSPRDQDEVARMAEALRRCEAESAEPICYLISGDLAHIGPKFDDPDPLDDARIRHCRQQDRLLLHHAEAADPDGYFRHIADEGDARRICGLPPTYVVLEALRPTRGRVLAYDQYVHPTGHESVSFASAAFYR